MGKDSQKTALITGASRGLGLALAFRLASEGWRLIINARGAADLSAAAADLSRLTTVVSIPGDIASEAHRELLVQAAKESGGLDVLINNAGILGPSPQPELSAYPLHILEEVYRINVIAPLGIIQEVQPHLKPGARIINISSDAAVEAYPGWGGYGSAKAALDQLTAILAQENPSWKIYAADPGDMRTKMHQAAFPGEDISDRPLPESSVPGLMQLIDGDLPSGRYRVREIETSEVLS